MAVVDELVTVLSTVLGDGSEKAVDTYKKGINSVVTTVKKATKQFAIAATGFTAFVSGAVTSAASIQKVSETTGVSTDALQEWAYAAQSVGVSASAVESDLAKMEKQAMWTGRSLESWADMFKGMSAPQANMWGEALGISPDTVRLLREGRDGIAALRKEAHEVGAVISEDDLKRAAQLKTSVMSLTTQLRSFGTAIAIGTLPMIEKLVDSFKEWLNLNKEWVATNITRFLENLGRVFNELWADGKKLISWFRESLAPVGDFAEKLWEVTDWAKVLKGSLALLAAYFAPAIAAFGAAAAAVTVLSIAIEDFIAFLEGKDSLIGRFVDSFEDKFPNLAALLKTTVAGAFKAVTAAAQAMWDLLQKIAGGIGGVVETVTSSVDKAIGKAREFFGLEDLSKTDEAANSSPTSKPYVFSAQSPIKSKYDKYSDIIKQSAQDVRTIQQSAGSSDKRSVLYTNSDTRPNVTNRNQTNQNNTNANITVKVEKPEDVGPTLDSLFEQFPGAYNTITPGTYGASVG